MNLEETKKLLYEVATIDNRKLSLALAEAWQETLHGYDYEQCRQALHKFWRNRPDDFVKPGHLVEVMDRRDDGNTCEHGIASHQECRDCAHPDDAPTHVTWPGTGDRQAEIIASLDLGKGRWTAHADPTEVLALKARFRAPGVVYPGERTCLDGHHLADHRPVMGANGRMCGHPDHHPDPVAQTEEVDW